MFPKRLRALFRNPYDSEAFRPRWESPVHSVGNLDLPPALITLCTNLTWGSHGPNLDTLFREERGDMRWEFVQPGAMSSHLDLCQLPFREGFDGGPPTASEMERYGDVYRWQLEPTDDPRILDLSRALPLVDLGDVPTADVFLCLDYRTPAPSVVRWGWRDGWDTVAPSFEAFCRRIKIDIDGPLS